MKRSTLLLLVAIVSAALAPRFAAAQVDAVVHGRVEDAVTRQPLEGVQVMSAEGASVALTDSEGNFALQMPKAETFSVRIEKAGYVSQDFELEGDPFRRIWLLQAEPEALELSGINVVAETAVEKIIRDLRWRRNSSQGAVQALDRVALERYKAMSVLDLIRIRVPGMFQCDSYSGLCVKARTRTLANPVTNVGVGLCVDGWQITELELDGVDVESVAILEIYSGGRGGIWVYTPSYLLTSARTGRNMFSPLMGC